MTGKRKKVSPKRERTPKAVAQKLEQPKGIYEDRLTREKSPHVQNLKLLGESKERTEHLELQVNTYRNVGLILVSMALENVTPNNLLIEIEGRAQHMGMLSVQMKDVLKQLFSGGSRQCLYYLFHKPENSENRIKFEKSKRRLEELLGVEL